MLSIVRTRQYRSGRCFVPIQHPIPDRFRHVHARHGLALHDTGDGASRKTALFHGALHKLLSGRIGLAEGTVDLVNKGKATAILNRSDYSQLLKVLEKSKSKIMQHYERLESALASSATDFEHDIKHPSV